jgi:hypothetical protein
MDIWTIIATALVGATSGVVYALLGWIKTQATKPEDWDHLKFIITMLTGAVVGAIAGANGWSLETSEAYLASIGAVGVIELAGKAIYRWLHKHVPHKTSPQGTPPGA